MAIAPPFTHNITPIFNHRGTGTARGNPGDGTMWHDRGTYGHMTQYGPVWLYVPIWPIWPHVGHNLRQSVITWSHMDPYGRHGTCGTMLSQI